MGDRFVNNTPEIDVDYLRGWIGREEKACEVLSPTLAERFHDTMMLPGTVASSGEIAPRLIHFCLCQPSAPMNALGADGHPARGGFLPPVPLQRRMWAGSSLSFHGDIRVNDEVERTSRIADVVLKQGRTGALCFVTVDHRISVAGRDVAEDRQTLVYTGKPSASAPEASPAAQGSVVEAVDASATLLFRYSALTFNGHRIHYDEPYCREVEGHRGLVVHGPLQATLLYHLAGRSAGQVPDRFRFRSLSTLYAGEPMALHAEPRKAGEMRLWTARAGGPVAMEAVAAWQ